MSKKLLTWITTAVVTTVMVFGGSASVFADTTGVSIKVSPKVLELQKGETETLTATIKGADSDAKATWETSNKKIASVEDGKVTATGAGMAAITASYGDDEATCIVTVEDKAAPEKLTVGPADDKIVAGKSGNYNELFYVSNGEAGQFDLKVLAASPEGASTKVKWSSSNSSITIDNSGEVTVPAGVKGSQRVTFTATSVVNSAVKASCNIYILQKLDIKAYYADNKTYLQIPENGVINRNGNSIGPDPSRYREYGLTETVSENEDVLYLKSGLFMYPVKAGTAKVTVRDKNNSWNTASMEVEVKGFFIKDPEESI